MPATIKQQQQGGAQQQQQQQEREQQKHFNINLCQPERRCVDVDADADADADVAPRRQRVIALKSTSLSLSTSRAVIIIMALVFSIIQQQQAAQQQQREQLEQQQQQLWPFHNGLENYHNNNNNNYSETENLTSTATSTAAATATQLRRRLERPEAEATNHTFKSLAFMAETAEDFDDGFAVSEMEMEAKSLPIFDFGMPRNITGRNGHTEAILKCRVDSLHDKSVSWIRKRDLHILTVGTATYTSDKRFQVTESKDAREWTLHVKAPQARDSGIYECQVNTEPKMSMAFQLNIIEISPDAKAVISGPHDLHFKAGSAIILNCVVQQPSVKDIGPIYWYRGEHMITPFDADDGEASKEQQQPAEEATRSEQSLNELLLADMQKDFATRIAMESQLGDTLKSRLRIANAQTADTGNYTCQPTTASSASVLVHVINDENPAAMQKSAAAAIFFSCRIFLVFWALLQLQQQLQQQLLY